MKKIIKLLNVIVLTCISHFVSAENAVNSVPELCIEGDKRCTFVLLSEVNNKKAIVNSNRANTQITPFSTFKVANSLIGLDVGIIKNTKQILTYDKEKYATQVWWPPVWKLPQYDLTSAFKYSMVPIYRQLATNIGQVDMQAYIEKFNYGNQDISSGLDDFWLNGSIKISAVEQVQFLQKVYHNQFSLKKNTLNTLKVVMLVESTDDYKLYAKTGAGRVDKLGMLGWYIGFVENSTGVHYFAFNFNRKSYAEMKLGRVKIAINHLKQAGII